MKTLISADTVRQAKASGQSCLPAGKAVLITPEARGLAEQLGIRLDSASDRVSDTVTDTLADTLAAAEAPDRNAIRAAILSQLPAEVAAKPALVEQIVNKVCSEQQKPATHPATPATPAATAATAVQASTANTPTAHPSSGGIKLVKGAEVHLGNFPGAGAEQQVGIADVITAADGAPIAAGFMAWSQCFFPWTLDYDEIDLVLEGELHIRCNGHTHVGQAGDVLYIPKGSAIEFGTTTHVRFFYVTYPANWQG